MTKLRIPPFFKHNRKDRSKIDWKSLDLWGITAIGDTFSCGGGLSLMSSHSRIVACPTSTFALLSALKCAIASGEREDWWGPHSTASQISSFDHGRPVFVGHPSWAYSARSSPTGWAFAIPAGHISFRYVSGGFVWAGNTVVPMVWYMPRWIKNSKKVTKLRV